MKSFLILFILFAAASCTAKYSEERFDFKHFFPGKNEKIVEREEVEMHFGPGPGDPAPKETKQEVSPQQEPEKEPKEEPSSSWWS